MLKIYLINYKTSIIMITLIFQMNKKKRWVKKYNPSNLLIKVYGFIESKKKDKKKVNHSQIKPSLKG